MIVADRQQRGITISDVARAAGVSKGTASVALRGATSELRVAPSTLLRVQAVAAELGYERNALAVALSSGRTYTIGLVSQTDSLDRRNLGSNAYQKDLIIAVTDACAQAGLRMSTILVGKPGSVSVADIADGRIDGAILATLKDDDLARDVFKRGFPAVTIGSGYSERRVAPDNRGGMESAVSHLAELGHRRIVYVQYPIATNQSWTTTERSMGFQEAMLSRGWAPRFIDNTNIDNSGLEEVFRCPPSERPTACVCFNDDIALEVLRWARRREISVPEQLSVVGFDDGYMAIKSDPRLTTVVNPLDKQAEEAIALLESLWRDDPAISPPPVKTRLIVRDSTAAAPAISKELEL